MTDNTTNDTAPNGLDWDTWLLSINWEVTDWHSVKADLDIIPWDRLQRSTVDHMARLHRRYDRFYRRDEEPEFSQAHWEQMRRLVLHTTPRAQAQPAPIAEWLGERPGAPRPTIPVATQTDQEIPDSGFMTIGYELDMPIAIYRRGGLLADVPHPDDRRGEAEEIVSDDSNPARTKRIVTEKVLTALNKETKVVAIRRDTDEGDEVHNDMVEELRRMDEGREWDRDEDAAQGQSSPSGPPREANEWGDEIEKEALECARWTIIMYFPCSDPSRFSDNTPFEVDRSLLTASPALMLDQIRRHYITTKAPNGVQLVRQRALKLLQLRAYQLRRDPRHVALEGMRPRYRAFSVYTLDSSLINLERVHNGMYADPPESGEDARQMYGWETVRVSSPVMPANPLDYMTSTVSDICRVMRKNFRVHRDTSAIPASMQIVISHTSGWSLIQLKKLLTLYVVLENNLRLLNREYRSNPGYRNVSGSLRRYSALGRVSERTWQDPNFDPDRIMEFHENDEVREANFKEMGRYLPERLVSGDSPETDRIFYGGMWSFTNVTRLCKALTYSYPDCKSAMTAQCRGGAHTEASEPSPDEEYEAARRGLANAFYNIVDPSRGVIKFRAAAHSLDPKHIMCWTTVCMAVVNYALNTKEKDFQAGLLQYIEKKISMFQLLGLSDTVTDFYRQRIRDDTGYFRNDDVIDQISWKDPFFARI